MPKPKNKVEFRYFLDPTLKAAAMRKARANGWTLTYVLDQYLKEWAADAPPPIDSGSRAKQKRD